MSLTHREAIYIAQRINGNDKKNSAQKAGFGLSIVLNPSRIETPEVLAQIEAYRQELTQNTLEIGLIDAKEIHEQLTDELRGDINDLYDDGQLKPMKDWPLWARQGGVEVIDEPNLVRSTDGENNSWDVQGRKITVKMAPRHKTREQAMKHVAVRAMIEPSNKPVNVHVTIEQRIIEARARLAKSNDTRLLEATVSEVPSNDGVKDKQV